MLTARRHLLAPRRLRNAAATAIERRDAGGIDAGAADWNALRADADHLDVDVATLSHDYAAIGADFGKNDPAAVAGAQADFIAFDARWNTFYGSIHAPAPLLGFDSAVKQFVLLHDEYQQKRAKLIALGVTPQAPNRPFLPPSAGGFGGFSLFGLGAGAVIAAGAALLWFTR